MDNSHFKKARDGSIFVDSRISESTQNQIYSERSKDSIGKVVFAAYFKSTKIADFEKCIERNLNQRSDAQISI